MERYTLEELYTLTQFNTELTTKLTTAPLSTLGMGLNSTQLSSTLSFLAVAIYGYFHGDLVVYEGEDKPEVKAVFSDRLAYDVGVKLPYWYKKYNYIQKLLTTDDLSLLQTSKMTSSSSDKTQGASGTLQKTATTPTGVSTSAVTDDFIIERTEVDDKYHASIESSGFINKYTNAQQSFSNASEGVSERSGEILREGSIDELLKILEKLPSSFADEINRDLQKHFIFDYEGEMKGIYEGE